MKNILLTLSAVLCLMGCNPKQQSTAAEGDQSLPAIFAGEWCNADAYEETGEYFNLIIEAGEAARIYFTNGGPFEEDFSFRVIAENELELYFESLMGSTSLKGGKSSGNDCSSPVMRCKIGPEGRMQIETFSDACGFVPKNIRLELHRLQQGEISYLTGESDSGSENPFSEVVATYSPDELKRLIGKESPENIGDLFLLLPDQDCFEIQASDRKQMLKGKKIGEWDQMTVGELDVKNRYLNISGAYEGSWEMFAKREGELWWIAVNYQSCVPLCQTEIASTYTFSNGTLTLHTDANLAGYQDLWPELFIDFGKLNKQQQQAARRVWEENEYAVLYRLPRNGKTITMYLEQQPYLDEDIPENAFIEVTAEMWQ